MLNSDKNGVNDKLRCLLLAQERETSGGRVTDWSIKFAFVDRRKVKNARLARN